MKNCWFCYKSTVDGEYHPKCANKFFGHPVAPTLHLDAKLLQELAQETINKRIAVTGVQPKLSVTLEKNQKENRLTVVGLWGEYILKPQHSGYAQMPETEDLTMHLASLFKVPVCDHTLLRATDGTLVYLAKRMDRSKGQKIHMEDLCQLSEFATENKYKGSYERVGKLISKYCTNTGLDGLNYFELLLFSYLTGNNDMHLKNFSVLHIENGIKLSPAYDLLNVNLVNPQDKDDLALTLCGKKSRITLADMVSLATQLSIHEKTYTNSFKKFQSKNTAVEDLIANSFLTDASKTEYLNIWNDKQTIFT